MKIKTLDDLNLNRKKVLLRVDLNCDLIDGKIIKTEKRKEHAKTIKE